MARKLDEGYIEYVLDALSKAPIETQRFAMDEYDKLVKSERKRGNTNATMATNAEIVRRWREKHGAADGAKA